MHQPAQPDAAPARSDDSTPSPNAWFSAGKARVCLRIFPYFQNGNDPDHNSGTAAHEAAAGSQVEGFLM